MKKGKSAVRGYQSSHLSISGRTEEQKNQAWVETKLSDKSYVNDFLDRIGYSDCQKSLLQKWVCKNCLFKLVFEQLATSNGDLKFQ